MSRAGRPRWRAPVLIATAALVAALIPSVFYVWGNTQIVTLGYRIESARLKLREMEETTRALELERARLQALWRIAPRARRMGLETAPPERILIVSAAGKGSLR